MVNKKLVIIVTIIAIIVVAGIVYFSINREAQDQYTFSEQNVENQVKNDVESNTILEENSNKEDVSEEKKEDDKSEKEDKQEVEENKVSESETNEKEQEKKEELQKSDGKDRAIELAKKEWGENDTTVYYYVEEQDSDNVYIISVRDQATTQGLLTYKVNIEKESVEEY